MKKERRGFVKKPTDRHRLALSRLAVDPTYSDYRDWLNESLELIREQNDTLDGISLTWNQGKAQAVNIILEELRKARV